MDEFLATVGVQAMRYAIRSGISLTSNYALGQYSRLINSVEDKKLHPKLKSLRKTLDYKIKIISPAIDLIEFKSGRGNIFLESAVPLAKSLQKEIASLGRRIEAVANAEEKLNDNHVKSKAPPAHHDDLETIIAGIKTLLDRIDREIPLLQLAITASGESLSTSLPAGISPSRLLQASTFLIVGDTQFTQDPSRPVQIGPAFTLSLYMLSLSHASTLSPPKSTEISTVGDPLCHNNGLKSRHDRGTFGLEEGARKPLWQEVLHKARVRLCRTRRDYAFDSTAGYQSTAEGSDHFHESASPRIPFEGSNEYAYHLEIIEDLDDGRLHDDDQERNPYEEIATAGIRESIPIHQVSKIFYTDTGRILNIGSATDGDHNPVLLLKRDVQAVPNWDPAGGIADFIEDVENNDGSITPETSDGTCGDDEQLDIDKQLFQESTAVQSEDSRKTLQNSRRKFMFPAHLDPEWIALEVYEEDESFEAEDDVSVASGEVGELEDVPSKQSAPRDRTSLDSKVVDQIKRLSLQSSTSSNSPQPVSRFRDAAETRDFVARSPFGTITTSLSLMEMLIRLTSLQGFQQASHLSIPDHILTFFLEETSTTGLVGETQWRVRSDAKRRMGFDPYTDTPTR
ncbi:RanGTP-binding protein-domain-containing protein [Ilyonectria robusta]|uniref:RanGTP-binding protein-domain-containing protein n=1 Tax=Ilyonectria robusta TaxID=1079257 RepID=UPI001E8EAECE|nr:RanGTP-binding protein-domain-containing protein [Ilyonectria robusta]KAH8729434.1 RanGTP-binding protein-domain-containing protein [Ilyonectria robusta]